MKSKFAMIKIILLTIILSSNCANSAVDDRKYDNNTLKMLSLFGDVFDKIKSDYVEEPNDKELIESAINGMLTSLDPHSSYLNDKDFEEMKMQTKGEFGGLGMEVTMENGLVKIISAIEDTPAYKVGLKAGDYIIMVDDEAVMGMSLNEAVKKMRGKPKTKVNLTIAREGESEPLEFTIERELIKVTPIKSKTEANDIAYIRITTFSETTANDLKNAYIKIKTTNPKIKGVVLDLRGNPGGLLDQAIAVSDLFLDNGEIVSTRGRKKEDIHRYFATKGDIAEGLPIIVLINSGSASASEIVAGALQDNKRAVILGSKSFGKGSVQTIIPIKNYGAMRITTSRYYTPSGRSIQAEGIAPDVTVENVKVEPIENKITKKLYSEANLKNHLDKRNKSPLPKEKQDNINPELESELVSRDYVLSRAIDLIKGLSTFSKQLQKKDK